MKIILFLFGLMIGSFAFGQSLNDALIKKHFDDLNQSTNSSLKSKHVKSCTAIEWMNKRVRSKSKKIFDTEGNLIEYSQNNGRDTSIIYRDEVYKHLKNTEIWYSSAKYGNADLSLKDIKTTYKNIFGKDSLEIDTSKENVKHDIIKYTWYVYDNHQNLIRKMVFWDDKNLSDEEKAFNKEYGYEEIYKGLPEFLLNKTLIYDYELNYDSSGRLIKICFVINSPDRSEIHYTFFSYENENTIVKRYNSIYSNEYEKYYFDNKSRIYLIERNYNPTQYITYQYDNDDLVCMEFVYQDSRMPYHHITEYIYQNGLLIKQIYYTSDPIIYHSSDVFNSGIEFFYEFY